MMATLQRSKSDIQFFGDKSAAREIASRRAVFNTAIKARDLDTIETVLAENAVLVPGDDAQLILGRAAQLSAWLTIFSDTTEAGYIRSPQRIEVNAEDRLAAEQGRWTGGWVSGGMRVAYDGRYFAKWKHNGLEWRIEAEVFVTMKREGRML
jgi:ketosteroid isomerase-like protein